MTKAQANTKEGAPTPIVKLGDNSLDKDEMLKIISRAEKLTSERAELTGDLKNVWADAKAKGYDTKIMKQVMKLRQMNNAEREEHLDKLDIYLSAAGLKPQLDLPLTH